MPSAASETQIRSDFDEIAELTPAGDRLRPYEAWLLAQLPRSRGTALEIGCGDGHLARRMAPSFDRVDAIDFSAGMIRQAKRRTPDGAPIEYAEAEMFEWLRRHEGAYDCIVTVATLHHVDLKDALRAAAAALKPGGRLLVLDLMARGGLLLNGIAWIIGLLREARTPRRLRQAFRRHGRNETYLTIGEARRVAGEMLPGARVEAHLLWRYSIVWDKRP